MKTVDDYGWPLDGTETGPCKICGAMLTHILPCKGFDQLKKPEIKVNDKVRFNYYDHDKEKEVSGIGRVKEIDLDNGVWHIQTTRTLHWMEYDEEFRNIRKI